MQRRSFLTLAAAAAPWSAAQAQGFPSKPIRIVVPNAPGGAADITARAVGEHMARTLGQPVIIDNKPGAGGVVAGQNVTSAAPDGYTLLLISSGTAVSQALFKSLPFDTLKAFAPVAPLATFDLVIVSKEGGAFKTLGDLIEYGRKNPGKLNIGTPNIGTTQHLAAELFKSATGLDLQVVPFKGTPEVVTAIRGDQIQAGLDILSPLLPQIQGKALRPLAVTGARRSRV
ncbi:MAG: tripartite tricarboxylate transporter substrate binding protein, partial [Proteobacteria bacterium]|nr:tripartite tricarboxylate transporter substrate binding protein [Pseudomonadota bacterium]